MVVYTGTVYNHTINTKDALALSGNIAFLSVFYVFIGSLLSFVLYYLFDEYSDENKEWEKRSLFYKISDVAHSLTKMLAVHEERFATERGALEAAEAKYAQLLRPTATDVAAAESALTTAKAAADEWERFDKPVHLCDLEW